MTSLIPVLVKRSGKYRYSPLPTLPPSPERILVHRTTYSNTSALSLAAYLVEHEKSVTKKSE